MPKSARRAGTARWPGDRSGTGRAALADPRMLPGSWSWSPSHSLTTLPSGPGRRRTNPARSSERQIWFTACRGEMPVRAATWSSSRGRELIRIAAAMRSRWLPVDMPEVCSRARPRVCNALVCRPGSQSPLPQPNSEPRSEARPSHADRRLFSLTRMSSRVVEIRADRPFGRACGSLRSCPAWRPWAAGGDRSAGPA